MANYGYLHLKEAITPEQLEDALRQAVERQFQGRMTVEKAEDKRSVCGRITSDGGPMWFVYIPNSAIANVKEASRKAVASEEDFGFPVALRVDGKTVAFRHPYNEWEHWAQACIEEHLSETLGIGITYDATGRTTKVGPTEYRRYSSFKSYILRNFKLPLSEDDAKWINGRFREMTPDGWWEE